MKTAFSTLCALGVAAALAACSATTSGATHAHVSPVARTAADPSPYPTGARCFARTDGPYGQYHRPRPEFLPYDRTRPTSGGRPASRGRTSAVSLREPP